MLENCSCEGTSALPDDCANATSKTIDGGNVFGNNTGALDENDAVENNDGWGTDGNEGEYYVNVFYTDTWTTYTTETTISVSFPLEGGSTVYFGVTNEDIPALSACVDLYH